MPVDEGKKAIAFRRLLLAKEIYLHGLDHSSRPSALNKMISVHNFHNAIEIVVKAIMLHFDVRTEKELNLEFEVMLNEVDKHEAFRKQGLRLPYRLEIRNLNSMRNMVQHHAIEPSSSAMEDWRVFTRGFLNRVTSDYFGLNFERLSELDLIEDAQLRELLSLAGEQFEAGKLREGVSLVKLAFHMGSLGVLDVLPDEGFLSSFFIGTKVRGNQGLEAVVDKFAERVRNVEVFAVLLSTGANPVDLKRLEACTPNLVLLSGGRPIFQYGAQQTDPETAVWAREFVIGRLVNWQHLGLRPSVPGPLVPAIDTFIWEVKEGQWLGPVKGVPATLL